MDVVADLENAHFRSKYVSLGALLKAVRPVLARHGLAIITTCWPTHQDTKVVVRDKEEGAGTKVTETSTQERDGHKIEAKLLWSGGGDYHEKSISSAVHCPKQASVHAFASFHTYARRWLIQGLCGVGVDLDDDGNAAVGNGNGEAKVQGNQELKQRVR